MIEIVGEFEHKGVLVRWRREGGFATVSFDGGGFMAPPGMALETLLDMALEMIEKDRQPPQEGA